MSETVKRSHYRLRRLSPNRQVKVSVCRNVSAVLFSLMFTIIILCKLIYFFQNRCKHRFWAFVMIASLPASAPAQAGPRGRFRGHCGSHHRTQTARGSSTAGQVQSAWNTPPLKRILYNIEYHLENVIFSV